MDKMVAAAPRKVGNGLTLSDPLALNAFVTCLTQFTTYISRFHPKYNARLVKNI